MVKAIGQSFLKLDMNLFMFLASMHEGTILKRFFKMLSKIGDGYFYFIFAVFQLIAGGIEGRWLVATAAIAFAIELPLYFILKKSVKRLRPFEKFPHKPFLIAPPDKYSFPSGHTAAAFLMAKIFSWQFAWLSLPLFMLAGLIGYSRIYLRVHYPSDVFFGMLLGILSAGFALMIVF